MFKTKHHKAAAIAAVLAAAPIIFLPGCGSSQKPNLPPLPPAPVSVMTVKPSPMTIGDTYLGQVTPYIQTVLSPAASGLLSAVNVRPGDVVKAGQVVATLDKSTLVPQQNAVTQAQVALSNAKQQYADALAMYNDRTSAQQQLQAAQNAVEQQKLAVQAAEQNLQKAQLQAQAALKGGGTPQDLSALQAVVAADQQAVDSAKKQLDLANSNLQILQQNLDTAKRLYGDITQEQVQQAYENYEKALASYNSWQHGAFGGNNPYANQVQAYQSIYNALNTGYTQLQQAQQQYNQGLAAVSQAQTALSSAQSNLANAQKSLADATPDASTNLAQQTQLTVQQAETSLAQAQAQYQAAQSSLKLAQAIYDDRTQAKQALDNALAQLKTSTANLQTAQATLEMQVKDGQVTTPISGYVQAVNAQVGQNVGPQTQMITIASMDPAMATVQVPEFDIGKLKVGTKMSVYVPTLNQTVEGKVFAIHPQLDSATNQYPVDIELDGGGAKLLPGMQVEARQETTGSQTAILVPADSVLSLQSGAQEVFVVQNGVAHSRIVQVGAMTSSQYEITSGLQTGDQLVVKGQNLLSDGDKVTIVPDTDSTKQTGSAKTGE
ncbi:efflux RND transporter periplasmic adaptor subunit [Alicyclobacillus macrosporangiidus]|uniref:RND family efflux transporter, MFP subunit n=1 Tax=Alicyclobacillus macrosporangiidus TaxID=392015 RepID=A0A1I7JGL3_9BACL|nr:efflux RND transporter periplasmic adaptor subunit [Alicyclobacillus macrosporangiidus]SFU84327.1 RND family efflux transporter, MFP subunit [Alicyclobacillus macrosporangiidus]